MKKASSIKSKLFSPSDIQSIMKKAMVERMKQKYHREHFEEDGVSYPVVKGTDNDQYLHLTYEKLREKLRSQRHLQRH